IAGVVLVSINGIGVWNTALGQTPNRPEPSNMIDANADRIITRQEWIDFQARNLRNIPDENVKALLLKQISDKTDTIDANRDGIIQMDELEAFEDAHR
ncbi:MAG: hypothetical protein AAF213_03140, partial [Pseudomonadota bacterium]